MERIIQMASNEGDVVLDPFMGGGTTIVEGARLGMEMFGNDYNPVAWFVVKNEMARVDMAEVKKLLDEVEAEVKPQLMPFYACDCPRGHTGTWTRVADGKAMGRDFDPLAVPPEERKQYRYAGPEMIYGFWAKHGPCAAHGCGHRTPIFSSPVMAVKELTVKCWARTCPSCGVEYDAEDGDARMAPGVPLAVSPDEKPFALLKYTSKTLMHSATCPGCGETEQFYPDKGRNKKVSLTLLVHPEWMAGEASASRKGEPYGGSATDDAASTARWNRARAKHCRLLELRGPLPDEVTCPETGVTFSTGTGTVPKKSRYACGKCGTVNDVLESVKASGKTGPVALYAIQGYCPECAAEKRPYNGRFFAPMTDPRAFDAAHAEWERRRDADLKDWWPRSEVPYGFMTGIANGDIRTGHGFTHWASMFNMRQLLSLSTLFQSITSTKCNAISSEYVLAVFQQYLRNQCMFTIWNVGADKLEPMFANNNYHPKSTMIENCVFAGLGRGNWISSTESLFEVDDWKREPWEVVGKNDMLVLPSDKSLSPKTTIREVDGYVHKTTTYPPTEILVLERNSKVETQDSLYDTSEAETTCASSTDLAIAAGAYDLVITDPPFGGLLHYSELSDFFYVWLRLALKERYPDYFGPEYTPKTLEAVANRARQPEDPDGFYKKLLTACWREAHRILKPGGTLAFTFHHSEDAPWVAVLESLFDAGFALVATYPIRSDETKGEGEFGSKKIEYDIIHVCRKRALDPVRVSWAKMRATLLADLAGLRASLELHQKAGLPPADLQVIRRGKALEYYSRHYGQIYKNDDETVSVAEALVGINALLDEDREAPGAPIPVHAEPVTRMFLRLFDQRETLPRDQIQKFLRGTGFAPEEYVRRGWCTVARDHVFTLVPAPEICAKYHGIKRKAMTSDYDQALFVIGACSPGSGITLNDTLENDNFRPHPALGSLLEWFKTRGATPETRDAAATAHNLFRRWEARAALRARPLKTLFD